MNSNIAVDQDSPEELDRAARQRAKVRQEVTVRRVTALRRIASLPIEDVHLAPGIARQAILGRDSR